MSIIKRAGDPCDNRNIYKTIRGLNCRECAWAGKERPNGTVHLAIARIANTVNHPAHYTAGGIEVIDAIEAWDLGFHLGNALKYIARAGKKDPAKTREDLAKARWYIDRALERLEAK